MTRRAALVLAAAASCAPPAATPHVRTVELPATYAGGAAGPSIASVDWRTFFADPNLNALIAEALAGNFDLQIALQRIEIARAGVTEASGARLPRVDAAVSGAVHKYGRYTMDGAGNAATQITPGRVVPTHLPDLYVGLRASWEADLWGRLKNLHGAARAHYLASVEGTNLVVTNLVADLASAYFELLALDETDGVVAKTIARQTEALDMMRLQKQAGRTNELAVQQFEAQLASTRALRSATLQRIREVENRINLLVGRTPRPIARTRGLLHREVAKTLAAGVPSELLGNRPDIRAAELEVEASRFDVAAARAAFFPHLTLSASVGYQAFDPRYLLSTPASIAYSAVAGLVAPLVNRRGIEARFASATATQIQAMVRYQRTVLTAFVEVVNGLSAIQHAAEIVGEQTRKREAVAETVSTADALFNAGKATYLEVLLAQQNTLDAELELIGALRDQQLTRIRLYKALGGGWHGALHERASPR